jgi:hypothetical protein
MGPMVAVVGSSQPERDYDPPVRDHARAAAAAEELGRELASQGCRIVVYSSHDDFIEHAVVRGYVASGRGQPRSIQVRGRYGGDDARFIETAQHQNLFDVHPEPTRDWEVSFYRSLLTVDGVLLIGGGRSTFVTGLIALSLRIPVAPIAAFGGSAEKVWHYLTREPNVATEDDLAVMAASWHASSAATLVASLISQHHRRILEHDHMRREQHRADRRTARSLMTGMVLLLLALATIPLSYAWTPGTSGSATALVVAPLLAATCGAIVRNAFDEAGDWLRTTVLGAAVGTVAFLLFIAAQLATTPDLLNGEGAHRLLFFVIPVGFTAGLTFDAVYSKLRSQDVTRTSALDGDQPK